MSNTTPIASSGVSFGSLLFLLFLGLKLCGVITWSWWWVTAPLWGPFAVIGVIALACLLAWVLAHGFMALSNSAMKGR